MNNHDISLKVEFKHSRERKLVALDALISNVVGFLENYGEVSVLGSDFCTIIGQGDGQSKFKRLLKAADFEGDARGFFLVVIQQLEQANSYEKSPIKIKDVTLPYLLVISILEVLIPGNKYIHVKNVRQLEKLTNIKVPADEQDNMQRVIELFPVRLSMHTIRQMRISPAISYQYLPFTDELNDEGFVHTWVGQFHRGIVEQMYHNRIIFILNMACPVYCRFCFRKHKECRNQKAPKQEHVKNALIYVRSSPDIKEIVLTGGDPFMNRATLTYAIDGLKEISHVQTMRLATRSISYYPHLFYANNAFWLNYLKRKQLELEGKDKRIEVATHFIHPDEISIESLDIISELSHCGIPVYIQTPLLNNCNDGGEALRILYEKLRGAGAEMHYIYIPCSPIKGNRRFVAPISRGMEVARYLRANLSDRAMPRICTATKIGKIDWNLNGWAVETDSDDERYIWIRTPYTPEYFSMFAPILQLENFARVNAEGTLDVKFMADIGEKNLLWGPREPKSVNVIFPPDQEIAESSYDHVSEALEQLQNAVREDQRFTETIVPTGSATLFRTHKTRVELDLGADNTEMKKNIEYIKKDRNITDVVVSAQNDVITSIYHLKELVKVLDEIDHVTAIRCRSYGFNYYPEIFTHTVFNQLGKLNNLSIVNPKRLEIETQFLHSDEFKPVHKQIAGNLRNKGIAVYNITPLLPFINDSEDEILKLAYNCRRSGIEFHHLYLAGLPVQQPWSDTYPLDVSGIIDIATKIRRYESGRSIPRFIIRSHLGEVDFGITSEIMESDEAGRVFVKLLAYDETYYKSIYDKFEWPDNVQVDKDGHPVIAIPGLKRTPEFLFS